jgi:hypothetical protein
VHEPAGLRIDPSDLEHRSLELSQHLGCARAARLGDAHFELEIVRSAPIGARDGGTLAVEESRSPRQQLEV